MFGGRQAYNVFPMFRSWWLALAVSGTGFAIGMEATELVKV